jgi:hypothetical protein
MVRNQHEATSNVYLIECRAVDDQPSKEPSSS